MTPEQIVLAVTEERQRQMAKHGDPTLAHEVYYLIMAEEFGEVAQAILQGRLVDARKELIETLACGFQWLENNPPGWSGDNSAPRRDGAS